MNFLNGLIKTFEWTLVVEIFIKSVLASLIPDEEISEENIIASALDKRVAQVVAAAVVKVAVDTGVARI